MKDSENDYENFNKYGYKDSSIRYSIALYAVLQYIKMHNKWKGGKKSLWYFVNQAIKEKLIRDFPEESFKIWKDY